MDTSTTSQNGAQGGQKVSFGVTIDKNKSAEQYILDVESKYIVPPLIREKFTDLVKLIFETESMNDEEREYWLQIMPIMNDEQIVKFRDIMINEREQLAKIDAEYQASNQSKPIAVLDEAKMKQKLADIREREEKHKESEESKEEELLSKLSGL